MKTRSGRIFLSLFLPALFFLAVEARADSVVITGGSISFDFVHNLSTFSFEGNGLSLHGVTSASLAGSSIREAGTTFFFTKQLDSDQLLLGKPIILGGVSYFSFTPQADPWFVNIVAEDIVLPPSELNKVLTLTSSFTINGLIRPGELPPGQSTTFTGQGTATAVLIGNGGTLWRVSSLTYNFGATPTPEPATLLLLGTGLAGTAVRMRKRRKARPEK